MSEEQMEPVENQKVVVGMLVALLVLGGVVGAGYLYSRKKAGQQVLPAGYQPPVAAAEIDCSQPRPAAASVIDYYSKCDKIKLDASAKLETKTDEVYGFTYTVPSSLQLVPVGNGVGITYKELTPNINWLYFYDLANTRSGELAALTGEDYVRNYWRQYPGLTGVQTLEKFTNGNGVTGYRAVYVIGGAQSGNQEVFYEIGEGTGNFVHFTRGFMEQSLFDLIVGSYDAVAAGTRTPTQGAAPTTTP